MKRRPWSLTLYAVINVLIALSMPLQVGFLQYFEDFYHNLSFLNYLVIVTCLIAAGAAFSAHKIVWAISLFSMVIIAFNNWWVGVVGFDFSFEQSLTATFFFYLFQPLLLEKKARQVLTNPKLKWWNRSERNQITIPVIIFPLTNSQVLNSKTFDISETGVFLQGVHVGEFARLNVGDHIQMKLCLSDNSKLICSGELVRKAASSGSYPSGIGIRFENLSTKDKKILKNFYHSSIEN